MPVQMVSSGSETQPFNPFLTYEMLKWVELKIVGSLNDMDAPCAAVM